MTKRLLACLLSVIALNYCNPSLCLEQTTSKSDRLTKEDIQSSVHNVNHALEKRWAKEPSNIISATKKEPIAILFDRYCDTKCGFLRLTKSSGNPRIDKEVLELVRKYSSDLPHFVEGSVSPLERIYSSIFIGSTVHTDVFKGAIYDREDSVKPQITTSQHVPSTRMETDVEKELVVRKINRELELSWSKQPLDSVAVTAKNPLTIIYNFDLLGNIKTIEMANSSANEKSDQEAVKLICKLEFKLAKTDRVTPYKYPYVWFISIFIGEKVYTDVFRFAEYEGYETLPDLLAK